MRLDKQRLDLLRTDLETKLHTLDSQHRSELNELKSHTAIRTKDREIDLLQLKSELSHLVSERDEALSDLRKAHITLEKEHYEHER